MDMLHCATPAATRRAESGNGKRQKRLGNYEDGDSHYEDKNF